MIAGGADDTLRIVRRALVAWFETAQRDLPWRALRDPYAIWISEIMLQQTRVDTVRPYFTRWLNRFPSVQALAAAPLDEVLSHWAGLGYYARARNLHAAAREVVTRYGGQFPSTASELRALPGIGAYTAGAIASIAFSEPAPIVDGNVVRVLARLDGLPGAANDPGLVKTIWQRAAAMVCADAGQAPGQLNQALMELGATVCTPTTPDCQRCPIAAHCRAHREDRVASIPAPKVKKPPRLVQSVALLLTRKHALLLVRRPAAGLWGGLWEPPTRPLLPDEPIADGARRVASLTTGLELTAIEPYGELEHTLTHRRMRFCVVQATAKGRVRLTGYDQHRWQDPKAALAASDFGIAAWTRRLLQDFR